jgi:spermidine/putrescine transport system permease protein
MSRAAPAGPLDYARRWPLRLWVGAVLAFLYLPLLSLIAFSFNDRTAPSAGKALPPTGS